MHEGKFDPRLLRQMQSAGDSGLVDAIVLVTPPGGEDDPADGARLLALLERMQSQTPYRPAAVRLLPGASIIILTAPAAFLAALAACADVRCLSATTVDFLPGAPRIPGYHKVELP